MLALIPYKCLKLGKPRPTPNAEQFKKKSKEMPLAGTKLVRFTRGKKV
jgi:hypothetical protein